LLLVVFNINKTLLSAEATSNNMGQGLSLLALLKREIKMEHEYIVKFTPINLDKEEYTKYFSKKGLGSTQFYIDYMPKVSFELIAHNIFENEVDWIFKPKGLKKWK
tara:strand:- start:72 stop:389 length:318 start_codon:yes stop_codon:yes gene_type:complete